MIIVNDFKSFELLDQLLAKLLALQCLEILFVKLLALQRLGYIISLHKPQF